MDRRTFMELLGSGIAAAGIPAAAEAQTHAHAHGEQDERPNFLFMIADDMTFRTIHALNNPEIHTPNLDRLVARGCAFTHCFQQGSWMPAVCAPSRTMLNSGLTAFNAMEAARRLSSYQPNDIDDMQSKLLPAALGNDHNQEVELALGDYQLWVQTFRGAGYHTYLCGKWHVDDVSMQRCFTEMGPDGPACIDRQASTVRRTTVRVRMAAIRGVQQTGPNAAFGSTPACWSHGSRRRFSMQASFMQTTSAITC
ncbi:MAG: sulfatase-like hydrolase/transferase [Acidobacteria bacterium]|nr:sulfatase-like hydrolase/transferase [Acidobacteriota bacterium]